MKNLKNNQNGFTLIEMSVVLVIVGLVVGGLVIGRDMILNANARAVITQIQNYDTAYNVFKSKYGNSPGDMGANRATSFGFSVGTGNPSLLGNGRLDDAAAQTVGNAGIDGELADFWVHLAEAKLINGAYVDGGTTPVSGINYPATKMKKGGIIAVSTNSINYWLIGIGNATTNTSFDTALGTGISPTESFNIDNKIDDGKVNTGLMFEITAFDSLEGASGSNLIGTSAAVAAPATNATCWNSTPPSNGVAVEYQLKNELTNCHPIIRIKG